MDVIGKLLPIEGYHVFLKGELPVDYAKSLTHLYQPLIGIEAVMLYQTLLHDRELQQETGNQTHHTLMNYMNVPLDTIYRARLKLEGIGLLKTFKQSLDEHDSYVYELQCPFAPSAFFKDEMLEQLLYHHIDNDKFQMLKRTYQQDEIMTKENNVTASFHDVFQTFQPVPGSGVIVEYSNDEAQNRVEMDFSWIEQMLQRKMIPVKKVLTPDNKKLITQMMVLYDLTGLDTEKAILWALTDENLLHHNEFKQACHDLFKSRHRKSTIKLTEKEKPSEDVKPEKKPQSRQEQFITELERMSPRQLLEDLSNGGQASGQDMKVIRDIMTTQGLPSPVMNVLIHYVLLQTNMKLSKAYMEKIASHWSRANLKTAREAMAFAKKEQEFVQKNKTSGKYNKRTNPSREVVPDWFKERKKKPQQPSRNNQEYEQNNDEFAALLKEFSNGNQK
ncbi:replication initiation and membrane attachment family protein [Virgibacillus siamensis]|uniref:replication initiation and membrane attachment family protein n=1 Tax=Virgibacillus siamensis TaxID=480071 RepID=UPI0009853812|nr:DnaD domain protein [Virgibacillus siamensis]